MDYNHRTAAELWQRFTERHQAEMTPAILKAGEFALEAHRGQNRKIDCLPYVSHVFDVAEILLGCKASENLVIAGILHDILEDTSQTADDIRALFPAYCILSWPTMKAIRRLPGRNGKWKPFVMPKRRKKPTDFCLSVPIKFLI